MLLVRCRYRAVVRSTLDALKAGHDIDAKLYDWLTFIIAYAVVCNSLQRQGAIANMTNIMYNTNGANLLMCKMWNCVLVVKWVGLHEEIYSKTISLHDFINSFACTYHRHQSQ